jgi:integrase
MGKRHQRGTIQERSGAFYLLYRVDGKQHSHRLCDKDRNAGRGSRHATAVVELAQEFMKAINGNDGGTPSDMTVAQFWQDVYLPFITANRKHSTVLSYQQLWEPHLKPHFADLTLREYKTPRMTNFLTSLAQTYRGRTLKHIKALASGIFAHAVATGHCDSNPMRDARVLGKTLPDGETGHYTLAEMQSILNALIACAECQLIMALCYFCGLRRGEIQGLQWSDIDADYIHVQRNISRGVVGTLKGKKKVKTLPLIEPVKVLLLRWRVQWPTNDGGWLFTKSLQNTAKLRIIPVLKRAGLQWKGYHAGRRGLGTELKQLTGNSNAGKEALGHESPDVTQNHYEKALPEELLRGMKLLEAKVKQ